MTTTSHEESRTIVEPIAPPRPGPGEPRPYQFPTFESRTLSNGLRLIVAPVTKLPVASVVAVIDAGAGTEPPERDGLALLTAQALLEGTTTRDGAALTEDAERLGGSLDASADWDAATITLTVLSERIEPALRLLADVLRTPAFPEREIERLKAERQAELLQLRAEPRGLADEMIERFVYSPTARYARPEGGSAASVEALVRSHVDAFYQARYRPDAVTLIVVGNVTTAEIEGLAEGALGGWTGQASTSSHAVLDTSAGDPPAVRIVRKSDAPQSEIRVAHVGLPRGHRDYFPVLIMNAVLGGLFSSRINLNLREVHAYTYGAHSSYDWRRGAGPFTVQTAVQSDVTDAALREILSEIVRIRAEPVEASELSLATSYLDGVFPIRYETASAIATALANLVIYGLPADYYDTYRSNVRGVTAVDVLTAARTHLDPARLQVVVVGDPDTVRVPLEGVGAGPVLVYDETGRPL
jgi:predicted Zn-dependent peptidase